MLWSSLLGDERYSDLVGGGEDMQLTGGEVPGIPRLQGMIEEAWGTGIDVQVGGEVAQKFSLTCIKTIKMNVFNPATSISLFAEQFS